MTPLNQKQEIGITSSKYDIQTQRFCSVNGDELRMFKGEINVKYKKQRNPMTNLTPKKKKRKK